MPISNDYIDYVRDQLDGTGQLVIKKMFGGAGLYIDAMIFALIENDTLRFKVDDTNRADYTTLGMGPFKPFEGKDHTMNYYEVPVEILEDPDELRLWAIKALAVARTAKKNKKRK